MSAASYFAAATLAWIYDASLEGKLLFSKHYQTTEDKLGSANRLMPAALTCTGNCYYCGTPSYCKSCSLGMYLKNGLCFSSNADTGFAQDLFEREFKPIKDPSIGGLYGCDSPSCVKCTTSSAQCDVPGAQTFCVRNSLFYASTLSCYGACPAGAYKATPTDKSCTSCSAHCLECDATACTKCDTSYLLSGGACVQTNCGNGIVEPPETCDDGNVIEGDGCGKYCLVEADFTCATLPPSGPSVCTPICGDGKYYGLNGEECDVGPSVPGDGCDANCKIEVNWWCANGSPTSPSVCHCSPQYTPSLDTFSSNFLTVTFSFSRPLALTVTTSDLCAILFGSYTSLFGNAFSCSISGKTIIVALGEGNKMYSGTIVPVASGVLLADDITCAEAFSGSVTVPTIPNQTVYGEISVLSLAPSCNALTIWVRSVSGGLYRPYTALVLTVSAISGGSSDDIMLSNRENLNWRLSSLVEHDVRTYSVTLPAGVLLPDVTYTLGLKVTNFQGISYQTAATFSTMSSLIVQMNLEGVDSSGMVTVERSQDLIVRTLPKLYKCGVSYPNISDVAVVYTQTGTTHMLNVSEITMSDKADRVLYIPGGTMKAGLQYYFSIVCKSRTTGGSLNSTSITIYSVASDLEPIISPSSQVTSSDSILKLSGTKSYDRKVVCYNQNGSG